MPMVNTPDLAMIARQGYLQQQQRLAQMGQMGIHNLMPPRGGTPQQGQSSVYMGITPEMREKQAMEAAARETMLREKAMRDAVLNEAAKKRARTKPTPAQQAIARQPGAFQPPISNEQYLKSALTAPPSAPLAVSAASVPGQAAEPIEPWADPLDEIDPRELAMARFRKRHEVINEVFGPETVKEIVAAGNWDSWEELEGKKLQQKVEQLEKETEELEKTMEDNIEAFRKKLEDIESGEVASA
ncbi:hypothetical protein I307_01346 [Cryptococcus deuterogattii 99/473]|uniref:Uncharacterized protein n=1 Tax=Cryptococcus deuterogattii Ram5 TaxID=1296110 RepID=A0A0D0UZ44_9TREE|nr:hypothetical protein I309_01506 [Cryptococcus deuterogattii LA55]KIR34595.1 hypothetical protein I352_02846 [Cryptococcus deuterogattii MMRL2647]KIR39469.1 hypothetical protein I313_04490 [Cryptococcus deuterogattii Ram5]KIR93296.1 hypothetical protein I304_02960 [Cryptococcus deuterogattii CBS 10090]KIY59099.1 hypothetical protein I307_01346 [Cryptococcus deuterogattii 99/473]